MFITTTNRIIRYIEEEQLNDPITFVDGSLKQTHFKLPLVKRLYNQRNKEAERCLVSLYKFIKRNLQYTLCAMNKYEDHQWKLCQLRDVKTNATSCGMCGECDWIHVSNVYYCVRCDITQCVMRCITHNM
eukprot:143263_1